MRYFYKALLFASLFFIGFTGKVNATHIMGSDITWECLGNDSFEVTLSVYRDCTGVSLGKPNLSIGCKSGSLGSITKTEKSYNGGEDVTPTCESSCTQCDSRGCSFNYGIQKHTVTYIVDFANSNCCKVDFSYNGCCRSNSITTGLAHEQFYVESWMDRCKAPCNSSPSFKEPPIGLLCKNQKFIYNQGASDDDVDSLGRLQDSLSYDFAKPTGTGPNDPLSYNGKYSYKKPLKFQGFPNAGIPFPYGFHLDDVTGDLKFKPTKEEVSVMAFKIGEHREVDDSMQQISEIRRDLQFFVIKCPDNKVPTITGMKCPDEDFYEEICAGKKSTFKFCTDDDNKKDSVTLGFNQGNLPGSPTFTVKDPNVKHPTGKLTWTPKDKHASPIPYQFTVSAEDDNCPVNGRTVSSFRLKVKPTPEADHRYEYLECGKYRFTATPIEGQNMSYAWRGDGNIKSNAKSFVHKFQSPGTYPFTLKVTAQGCSRKYYDTIKLDPFLRVNIGNDTVVCKGSTIQLGGKAKDSHGPVTYTWHDSVTGTTSRTFKNLQKDTFISLTVEDTVCAYTDSVFIDIRERPEIDLGTDPRICADDTARIAPKVRVSKDSMARPPWLYLDDGNQAVDYKWYKNNTATLFSEDSVLTTSQSGDYILRASDTFGCFNYDTIAIKTNPPLKPTANPKSICRGDTSELRANKTGGPNVTYTWTNLKTQETFSGKNIDVSPDSTTKFALVVEETTKGVYCRDSATTTVNVKPLPEVSTKNIPDICSNGEKLDLSQYGQPIGGDWSTKKEYSDAVNSNVFDPTEVKPGVKPLTYEYKSPATQCTNTALNSIKVLELPKVNAGQDKIVCTHEDAIALNPNPTNPPGDWAEDGVDQTGNKSWIFNHKKSSVTPGVHSISYSYTDPKTQCTNTDTMKVTVQQSPEPDLPDQSLCIYEPELNLTSVANKGSWIGDEVEHGIFNNPKKPGTYEARYRVTTEVYKTCEVTDTIAVEVHDTAKVRATTASGDTAFCESQETVQLKGTPPSNGKWTVKGPMGTVEGSIFSPSENGAGNYVLKYTYTDPQTGCKNSHDLALRVDPQARVALKTTDDLKCVGQPYKLEAAYEKVSTLPTWYANGRAEGAGFKNVATYDSIIEATYEPNREQQKQEEFKAYIRAENNGICPVSIDSILVDLKPVPKPEFNAPKAGCPPFMTEFENQSTISEGGKITRYTWLFGDGERSLLKDPVHQYKEPGKYTVRLVAESAGGCKATNVKEEYITVHRPPDAQFIADPVFTTISTPVIDFKNRTTYEGGDEEALKFWWHFGDDGYPDGGTSKKKNPSHSFSDTGRYTIRLITEGEHQCQDTMLRKNYVKIDPAVITYAPNAFSPDGDGKNDVYRVEADNFTSFKVSIFNRWGELLYTSENYEEHGWDGTYKGEKVPNGSYMYIIKTIGLNGEEYTYSGTINVIK